MTCEKAEELLSAYLDDMLAPQLSQEVAAHVEGCASCRETLADYRRYDESLVSYIAAEQLEPSALVRDRIFDSAEFAAIVRQAAENEAAKDPERVRSLGERPRRAAAPPGWARGAVAAAVALLVFGSALLIKQGLVNSGTPSAQSTTVLNGHPGTKPLAAGQRVIFARNGELWSVLAGGTGPAEQLTPQGITVGAWSVSPNGQSVAYVDAATGHIHVIRSDDQNDAATTSTALTGAAARLVWSPDGLRIAYLAGTSNAPTLHIMNADGSNDIVVTGATGVSGTPVWSGDAAFLAYAQQSAAGDTVWVYNAATKLSREIAPMDPSGGSGKITVSGLVWQNDPANPRLGWATTDGTQITGVYTASALSGGAARQTAGGATLDATNVSWSPDGAHAAYVTSAGQLAVWSASAGVKTITAASNVTGTVVWSTDGQRVAVASGNDVLVVNATSGAVQRVAAQGAAVSIAFAPTGSGIAIATASGTTIYTNAAGTPHLITGAALNGALAWSVAG